MATATYPVTGMTCEHCVASVTEELMELPGVSEVAVDLVSGGTSSVHVTSEAALDQSSVAGAIDEAGYRLA